MVLSYNQFIRQNIWEDLKWESHINSFFGKTNKTLGFLRRNLNIGYISVKEQAYKSLVRPSLEYACSVWDPHLISDINKIEMVQRRAAWYVTNRQRNAFSVGDMPQHLKWRSPEDRRRDACLVIMYKISHDKVAVSKSDILSPPPRDTPEICTLSHIRSHYVGHNRERHHSPSHHCRLERLPQTAVMSDSAGSFRAAIISSYP